MGWRLKLQAVQAAQVASEAERAEVPVVQKLELLQLLRLVAVCDRWMGWRLELQAAQEHAAEVVTGVEGCPRKLEVGHATFAVAAVNAQQACSIVIVVVEVAAAAWVQALLWEQVDAQSRGACGSEEERSRNLYFAAAGIQSVMRCWQGNYCNDDV